MGLRTEIIRKIIYTAEANARMLDCKDRKEDDTIQGSIWNEYAEENGLETVDKNDSVNYKDAVTLILKKLAEEFNITKEELRKASDTEGRLGENKTTEKDSEDYKNQFP